MGIGFYRILVWGHLRTNMIELDSSLTTLLNIKEYADQILKKIVAQIEISRAK